MKWWRWWWWWMRKIHVQLSVLIKESAVGCYIKYTTQNKILIVVIYPTKIYEHEQLIRTVPLSRETCFVPRTDAHVNQQVHGDGRMASSLYRETSLFFIDDLNCNACWSSLPIRDACEGCDVFDSCVPWTSLPDLLLGHTLSTQLWPLAVPLPVKPLPAWAISSAKT